MRVGHAPVTRRHRLSTPIATGRFGEASNCHPCRTVNQWVAILENLSYKDIHGLSHGDEFREHDGQPPAGRLLTLGRDPLCTASHGREVL